ncbi:MAG: hypothetical protein H0X33_07545 [Taibaiella sp.]|nr:hypothetical protein [Taibaiella sp.]
MKKIKFVAALFLLCGLVSCTSTTKEDNSTQSTDTMVIKQDKTDSATHTITTDTTKR